MTGGCRGLNKAAGVIIARRRVAVVFLVLAVLLAFPAAVLAHSAFVRSEPAPGSVLSESPNAVTVWFTEPVEANLSKIDVLNATGERVNTEESSVPPGEPKALTVRLPHLPDGTYTVAWKAFSAVDGHSMGDSFIFYVGISPTALPPAGASSSASPLFPSPIEPALRWLSLLSVLTIVGFLVFELSISQPILNAPDGSKALYSMGQQMESRTLTIIFVATGLFLAASVGELVAKTYSANNVSLFGALGRPMVSVLQTGWGNLWLWRTATLLGMIGVLALASLDRARQRLSGRREWQMVALVFAAGILFTLSLASHGAAVTEIRLAAIFSDYLHLIAASVWVGGIFYLAMVVPPVMKVWRLNNDPGIKFSGAFCPANHVTAMKRFSILAILSVGVLVITGIYNSWAQVTVFSAFITPYGITLLAKLFIIMPLLLLGAFNFFRVRPRLPKHGGALSLLRKTVAAQAILAVVVLALVGALVSMEPARQVVTHLETETGRYVLQSAGDEVNVKAVIQPATIGPNVMTFFLTDRDNKPVSNATAVTLQLTYRDADIGSSTESAIDHGEGIWVAHQPTLSVAGNWQALLTIQRPDAFDARVTFSFHFPPPAGSPVIAPSARAGKFLWGVELSALGLLIGGVSLYAGGRKTRSGIAGMMCGGAAILAGVVLVIVSLLA